MFLLRESSRNDNVGSIGKFLPDVIECIDSGRFTLRAPERECHGLRIGLDVPRNLFFRRMASTAQGKMSIRRQLKRRYAPAFIQKLQACLVGMSGLLVGARHIIDNQGAVSRCKAIPKLRPEHIASSV